MTTTNRSSQLARDFSARHLSLASAALLGALALLGCSGSAPDRTALEPELEPLATLGASEQTSDELDIVRWEVRESSAGRFARGVNAGEQTEAEAFVEMHMDEADGPITFRALPPNEGLVLLDRRGTVQRSDSEQLEELAVALFRDAQQPALFRAAVTDVQGSELGAARQKLSSPATLYLDTGMVNYDPWAPGCFARTSGFFFGSTFGYVSGTSMLQSTYLFGGCRATVSFDFKATDGSNIAGPTLDTMACAVWDPTCPSRQDYPLPGPGYSVDLAGKTIQDVIVQHTRR